LILGDTDSEHLFYYLLSAIGRNGGCRAGRTVCNARESGKHLRLALFDVHKEAQEQGLLTPIMNVLLTDGRMFFAHRAGMPLHVSTQKHFCADFHTCEEPSKVCMLPERPADKPVNHLLVASERIGDENVWEDFEDGSTLVLDEEFRMWITAPPSDWTAPILPEEFRIPADA